MLRIIDSKILRERLREELEFSRQVTLLSAYVTSLGVDWLLKAVPSEASLVVVGRFLPMDLITGGSDTRAVRMLLEQGHTVKALASLHAKIFYIDGKKIFLGSANCTGKGLGLVEAHNLEASVKFEADEDSKELIANIIDIADQITFETLEKMEAYVSEAGCLYDKIKQKHQEWPEEISKKAKIKRLFVKDFPLMPFGESNAAFEALQGEDYLQINRLRRHEVLARAAFKNSKSYVWLIQLLSEVNNREGVSFGKLSSLIHGALADDPAPYRRTVKDLQVNLYSYLAEYASDAVEFFTPGERSQFVRLRN